MRPSLARLPRPAARCCAPAPVLGPRRALLAPPAPRSTRPALARAPTLADATAGTRAYSTRDNYYLRPLKDAAPAPGYDYKFLRRPAALTIVPIPFSGGQNRTGVDLGPNHILRAGLSSQLAALGWDVSTSAASFTDVPYNPVPCEATGTGRSETVQAEEDADIGRLKNPRLVSAVCERVKKEVEAVARRGEIPLTLGGDHSLGMGTVAGVKAAHPDAAVIWVDAHADINTPASTDTGNIHGMPVAFLLGLEGTDVAPFSQWLEPCLKPKDIVFIGLRDVDAPEKRILRALGIKCFTMHDVDRLGIGRVMELALDHVDPARSRPIHLSFDVDAMDPSVAPSTGTPVRGGLTFREGHYITEAVAETGCLVGLDIMEVNPSLLDNTSIEQTVAVGCSLARAALGETLL
ncbi:Arginase, catabolizes arginine to ornithine and urea [Cryptotrichosporon argae]